MRRLAAVCCVFAIGCASFRDAVNQDMLYWKMNAESVRVWKACRDNYPEAQQPYHDDFELGFCDGYLAVAFGANGCPPTLPRQNYWKPRYKNDEGKARIATWYNGYAAGAYTALSTGVQDRNRLPTASQMYGRHDSRPDISGTAIMSPTPTTDQLPPEPELQSVPTTPPLIEPLPLPADPQGAWRSKGAVAPIAVESVQPATWTSESVIPEDVPTDALQPTAGEEPGLSGSFGLSRPE